MGAGADNVLSSPGKEGFEVSRTTSHTTVIRVLPVATMLQYAGNPHCLAWACPVIVRIVSLAGVASFALVAGIPDGIHAGRAFVGTNGIGACRIAVCG